MTHHYTVLVGGTVLSFDGARPGDAASRAAGTGAPDAAGRRATALCYAHDRILAVGSDEEILSLAGPDSTIVHLGGRAVLPGFVEPHAHPYWEGLVSGMALLGGRDRRGAIRGLPGAAERLPPDAWLVARYDPTAWDRPDDPTRDELDRAVPDRPVLLAHVSGHAAVANSLALAMAAVGRDAPDLPGKVAIERAGDGEPTGVLRGPEAWDRIATALPAPTAADGRAAIVRAAVRLAADGVTSVADADVGSTAGVATEMAAWAEALASQAMPLRVALMPGLVRLAASVDDSVPSPSDLAASVHGLEGDRAGREPVSIAGDRVRLTHAKLKADGALTTRTAWLRDAYLDAPHVGGPVHEAGALAGRIRQAAAAGWAVATHAIGDAAVDAVLDAVATTPAPLGTAHRIEHAMLLDGELIARLAASGMTAVVQPEFLAWAGQVYVARLGADRAARLLPFSQLLAAGVPMAFSSDRPVVPGAPLDGVRAALRHDPDLSVAEALHAWTAAGAAVLGDDEAGLLAMGRPSDLVILSGDPTAVSREAWAGGADAIQVDTTIAAGIVVHGSLEDR